MGKVSGRVGGIIGGFDVDCTISARSIEGRIGGLFRGADINFVIDQQGLITGRIGGEIIDRKSVV